MQPRTFSRVAHPILIIILTLAILTGQYGFAYAAPGEQKIFYYLPDHLGGIDKVTDEQGNVVCSNDYLPFGDLRRGDCTENDEDYGFTGKEKDPETDLYYYGARYYDPILGRFVSPDPLSNALDTMNPQELQIFLSNPQNLNPYSYVKNNPLRYTDPTGQYEEDVHFALTYYLAQKAGLGDSALSIAYYDQYTDDNSDTSPYAGEKVRADYHFVSGERYAELRRIAEKSLNDKDIGQFLHAHQDSFSHEGYEAKVGHCCTPKPDKTYNDVEKADRMSYTTFWNLRRFNRLKNGLGGKTRAEYDAETKAIWKDIQDTANAFNQADTKEEKQRILSNPHQTGSKKNKK